MTISITESIHINRPPEAVWDYTQDYARRREWDPSILEAQELSGTPERRVRIQARGGLACVFQYRLSDRPRRTSVIMIDVRSALIAGGGGSWQYEPRDGGCEWTQVVGLTLKDTWLARCVQPLMAWMIRRQTRSAMLLAKGRLEQGT